MEEYKLSQTDLQSHEGIVQYIEQLAMGALVESTPEVELSLRDLEEKVIYDRTFEFELKVPTSERD